MGDGFGGLIPLGVGDGEHVERVIVVRILIPDKPKMSNGLIVLTAIDGESGRVQALVDRLRRILALCGLPLADVQIQPNSFVQFFFVGILPEHGLERVDRRAIVVPLQRLKAPLVQSYGFEIGRSTLWRRRAGRSSWIQKTSRR